MASAAIFSSLRRSRSPSLEAFLAPVDLEDETLVETLAVLSAELVSSFSGRNLHFQRRNLRSLIRKLEIFAVLFDSLRDSSSVLSPTASMCFKELYLSLYRSKILLDYCFRAGKLWLLLQNQVVSGYFHDLNLEISILLDVLPLGEFNLGDDVREQVELLRKQIKLSKLLIDKHDDALRLDFYSFLHELDNGRIPDCVELFSFFVVHMGMKDARSFRLEIEILEEQVMNYHEDIEPTLSVINGFVALTRYCRFLLFGFEEDEAELSTLRNKKPRKGFISKAIADTYVKIPKDFCCSISLDLMSDPVIVSTGQTYDRASISRWIEEGHYTCPKTGQMFLHCQLVPNRALRNLIVHWCAANEIPYDPPENADSYAEAFPAASASRATIEANKATTDLLIHQLAEGSLVAKAIAAREMRFLAKTARENRSYIAEAGAIPHLKDLLSSSSAVAQENSVTAILNLSIFAENKSRIMEEEGCLRCIVQVLRHGHTTEARENAAATLFSLSSVHGYKKRIATEEGAVEALVRLLREGTRRGKKDAITGLYNLLTHTDNRVRIIETGVIAALAEATGVEGVAEEAAGALALIVRHPIGAEAVGNNEMAVAGLLGMMKCGTPRGKENAVAALLEMCRSGGLAATERVLKAPSLAGLLQALLFTGTRRARRKAASLVRVFQRGDNALLHYGHLGLGYDFLGSSSFVADASLATPVSVSVL